MVLGLCLARLWAVESVDAPSEVTVWGKRSPKPVEQTRQLELDAPQPSLAGAIGDAWPEHVRDFGSAMQPSYLMPRGQDAKQTAVFLDQVPFQSAMAPALDLSLLPPQLLQRVTLGGDQGQAPQTIQLQSAQAARDRVEMLQEAGSESTLMQAVRTQWAQTVVDVSHRVSQGNYRFNNNNNTVYNTQDDFWDARSNNDAEQVALLTAWNNQSDQMLQHLGLWYSHTRRGVPGSTTYPSDTAREVHDVAQLSAKGLLGGVPSTVWYGRHDYSLDDSAGDLTGVATTQRALDQRVGWSGTWPGFLNPAWTIEHEVLQSAAYNNPVRSYGRLELSPQYDLGELHFQPRAWTTLYSDVANESGVGLSASHGIGDHGQLRASAGTLSRVPSFGELYFDQGLIVGNPALRSERGWQWEASAQDTWFVSEQWAGVQGRVAYYQTYMSDLIQWANPGGFQFKSLNVGQAQMKGAEGSFATQCGWGPRLEWQGAMRSAIDTGTGLALPGRPDVEQRVKIEQAVGVCLLNLSYVYESGTAFASGSSTAILDRSIWNARAQMGLGDRVQIYGNISNIFDVPQQDMFGFPLPGRTFLVGFKSSYE